MEGAGEVEQKKFKQLVELLTKEPGTTQPRRKGFGQGALWVKDRIFAFLDRDSALVVKLPNDRVVELVSLGTGRNWDPGSGRLQREWMVVTDPEPARWLALAKEARTYVGSQGSAPRRRTTMRSRK